MIKSKINIFSSVHSPRLAYTLDFIFTQFFDCGYNLVDSSDQLKDGIVYAPSAVLAHQVHIPTSDYLTGTDLMPDPESINPDSSTFDLFAFVFYCLSRAEEYNFQTDESFGRFTSSDSSLGQLIDKPLVDLQLLAFAQAIEKKCKIKLTRRSTFKLIHTVDVDQFYAFKHKSLKRTIGGLVSSTLKANVSNLKDRKDSLTKGDDPYDTFPLLRKQSKNSDAYYFILVGNYDKIDNALDISQSAIKTQLAQLAETAEIGLHPSVKSTNSETVLQEEKAQLEKVIASPIKSSRQHFLKLNFPASYQQLLGAEIKSDHSLGYHDAIGFRAGTSNPFYWFDLSKNEATELLIQPLLVMDVTLKKHLALEPDQAIRAVKQLIDLCKEVDAPFSLLWHNSSFYEQEGWAGWKEVYVAITDYCGELTA